MLKIFQSKNDNIVSLSTYEMEKGCWLNLVNPSEEELQKVAQTLGYTMTS